MNWMNWIHASSLSALAAAVVTLGVVMLLELRAIARLRSGVERDMARLFEQLDLLRLEGQQLMDGQAQLPAAMAAQMHSAVPQGRTVRAVPDAPAPRSRDEHTPLVSVPLEAAEQVLPAGEARLLRALHSARERRSA